LLNDLLEISPVTNCYSVQSLFVSRNNINVTTSNPVLGFEDERLAATGWYRYLTIEGKRAYIIGTCCETCEFLFERVGVYNEGLLPSELSERFRAGLREISEDVLQTVSQLFPSGCYDALLFEVYPYKVALQSDNDYFCNEQRQIWPIDAFWGLPHYPKVEYYRSRTLRMNQYQAFFEFIIPTMAPASLELERVEEYIKQIELGNEPTALAVSVLDTKEPAMLEQVGEEIIAHSCLSHYVLDGHHKLQAASITGRPITLLSLLAKERGFATDEDLHLVSDYLKR
jgi:hypothetical protein